MVDDQPDATTAPADSGRPKRAPPTIDLEATEVSRTPADPPPSDESDAASEPAADAPHEASKSDASEPAADGPPAAPPRSSRGTTAVIAALVGALAACGIIGAAVWAGWPAIAPPPPPAVAPAAPDTARLDALTQRLAALEARPAPTPSAASDAAQTARLDALEQTAETLRGDVATLRTEVGQLTAALNDVKTAAPAPAAAPDLSGITTRLGQLESTTRALSTEAAQPHAAPFDDKPLRRILAVTLLDRLVRQGDSYVAALAAAKPLVPQPEALKPLERFAASGVPSANVLSKQLLTQVAAITPAEPKPPENAGILERLQAGAERLVRIRRTETPVGAGPGDIVHRAAAAARRDDIASARRELGTLPAADRAPFQSWLDLVDARDAALAASRQLAADAVAALGQPAR